MPRLLTARFVETVKAQRERKEYGDASGGRLLVHPSGIKTWVHRYRDATGKTCKATLGPATGEGALSLSAMREAVARDRRQLERGVAPPRTVPAAADDSVATQAAHFLAKHHHAHNRSSTATAAERTFNNVVLPAWGNRAVQDVRRRDVIALVEATAAQRGPEAAGHLHRTLSAFFAWLLTRDVIETSPCLGVAGVLPPQAKPRQRTLDHQTELLPLLKVADTDHPADRAVAVLIYSGQRRNEVGGMRWSELDSKTRIWTISAERAKNGIKHRVPLPTQVWEIINAQPRIVGCDYVFTATGRVPVNGWAEAKTRLTTRAGIDEKSWRLHDLRRTAAAGMQRLGVRLEVIERVLNHRSGSFAGIVGVYQVDPLESEVRLALQSWADYLEGYRRRRLSVSAALGGRDTLPLK
jgi:integrase